MSEGIFTITESTTIKEIEKGLHDHFPFLRFEFFLMDRGNPASKKPMEQNRALKDICPGCGDLEIKITGETRLGEMVAEFEKLGIQMDPYRKSGKVWIKTTLTLDWSLSAQNSAGKSLSL